jgi:hypothetical protein
VKGIGEIGLRDGLNVQCSEHKLQNVEHKATAMFTLLQLSHSRQASFYLGPTLKQRGRSQGDFFSVGTEIPEYSIQSLCHANTTPSPTSCYMSVLQSISYVNLVNFVTYHVSRYDTLNSL